MPCGSFPTPISARFVLTSLPTSIAETELRSGLATQTKRSSEVIWMGPDDEGLLRAGSLWESCGGTAPGSFTSRVPTKGAGAVSSAAVRRGWERMAIDPFRRAGARCADGVRDAWGPIDPR